MILKDDNNNEYFELEVTQSDIDECVPKSPYYCAINRALRKTYQGTGEWIHVSREDIVISEDTYECSPNLWDWQNDLDNNKHSVSPITIEFDAVTNTAKLNGEL